ncbi:MAG: hypothetical protein LBE92_03730 [Chryseobacterium sp.]|jgi:hypothetical protein|uniref:hypothetical protein n=1 Tax=Chryseobacterium sp. TaxID=1871047 RepID=UPI0028308638|nr:hypothetical protein [Chryseobacterium sp.]MDR2235212.1 hypothetical protein [Chryseobacterium sp.]
MMENKEKYYKVLIDHAGRLNEIDLGEKVGLNENETNKIIAELLSEYKIEYTENSSCNYSPTKRAKRKNKDK